MPLNDLQDYFVSEFVLDYKQGFMSRRDMMKRVLHITGGVASTASLLTLMGCGSQAAPASSAPAAGSAAPKPAASSPVAAASAAASKPATSGEAKPAASAAASAKPAASGSAVAKPAAACLRLLLLLAPLFPGRTAPHLDR